MLYCTWRYWKIDLAVFENTVFFLLLLLLTFKPIFGKSTLRNGQSRGLSHRSIVVGDGPAKAELENMLPNTIFTGLLSDSSLAGNSSALYYSFKFKRHFSPPSIKLCRPTKACTCPLAFFPPLLKKQKRMRPLMCLYFLRRRKPGARLPWKQWRPQSLL